MSTCDLKNLIINDLAINLDINNIKSWNLNDKYIINSINKWHDSVSDDLTLMDFGLTAFDNGRVDNMVSELNINKNDIYLNLYRIGKYDETGNTITYNDLTINPVTGTSVGNYFNLDGGYFQGFFKLYDYNYEIFPARYNNGITIETLIELLPNSNGIFYYMGSRAEDKYNSYYNGEAINISGSTYEYDNNTGYTITYSGLTTSEGNFFVSTINKEIKLDKFQKPEESLVMIDASSIQKDNLKNNVISFEITTDRRIKYSLIDEDLNLIQEISPNQINKIGWTLIDIVYKPYNTINNFKNNDYKCYPRRKGELIFYVNGRIFWKIKDFNEFFFTEINNDREKQIGVPFNISWGGGSFGLKHSYHYNVLNTLNNTISGVTSGTTLSIDNSKSELLIEKYFNNSFIGNIQKLRIYTNALKSNEILNNLEYEINKNPNYNINILKGGRIIN